MESKFLQENGFLDSNTGKISLADKLEGKTKQSINDMSKLKRIVIKFIKFLAHKIGYDVALVEYTPGEISLQGDVRLLKFVDTIKYMQHIRKVKNIE